AIRSAAIASPAISAIPVCDCLLRLSSQSEWSAIDCGRLLGLTRECHRKFVKKSSESHHSRSFYTFRYTSASKSTLTPLCSPIANRYDESWGQTSLLKRALP